MPKRLSTRTNSYYQRLIALFTHAAAYMPFIMIPFGILARGEMVDGGHYASDAAFAGIVGLYSFASAIYFWLNKHKPSRELELVALIVFHILTLLFILFVSGFLSAFLAVWIVLMISADMYFGTRGFIFSFAGLCLAGALSILVHPNLPSGERLEIIQGAFVVGAIGYIIARIRKVTEHERMALAKTREQEMFQRQRLLALVNSMGDAVITTNQDGIIKVYNAATLSLLDTNAALTGKSLDDILQLRDQHNNPVKIVEEANQKLMVFSRTDVSHRFEDDEVMKLYVNVAPIRPGYQAQGESGFIFVLRDITREKSLEEERDEFISVVSHELRTPIAIAEGNLSNIKLLQERGADKTVLDKAVEDAHGQILYLAKMINDLSTLSRAERGVAATPEEINVAEMIQTLYNEYETQASNKKLHLNLDLGPRLPVLETSRLYLEEILQNLVTNAIKYTKEGSVTVKAHAKDEGVEFAIVDTGIGISKTDQKHIFEKFFRSEDYRTRETTGTGLGLYVVHKLAEKLGTKIHFSSRLNHGSTFSFVIKNSEKGKEE